MGCIDTSCAANSGTTCSSSLTGVANIISAVSGAALSASEAASYNNLVSTQLSRAQQGLSPLTLSSTTAGIPTIPGLTSGTSTLVLLGGAALLLYLLLLLHLLAACDYFVVEISAHGEGGGVELEHQPVLKHLTAARS